MESWEVTRFAPATAQQASPQVTSIGDFPLVRSAFGWTRPSGEPGLSRHAETSFHWIWGATLNVGAVCGNIR